MLKPRLFLIRALAIVCYLIAMAGAGVFAVFVLLLGIGAWPFPLRLSPSLAYPVNLTWLIVFGVQHSTMARESFKAVWTRLVGTSLERSLYVAISGVLVAVLPLVWQPISGPVWWRLPVIFVVIPLLAGAGLALINARYDHAGLFGLRQAWWPQREPIAETLIVSGPYRLVRHPLMTCLLAFLWTQPVMTPALALLAGGLSGYVALGLWLEERDLARRFHPEYDTYRQRVPMLLPWRWRG